MIEMGPQDEDFVRTVLSGEGDAGARRWAARQEPDLHCQVRCSKHDLHLAVCDECGNTIVMGAWARELPGYALAIRLEKLDADSRYFSGSERHALLAEAASRLAAQLIAPESHVHIGMEAHDGYVAHSHEVRPDHKGVARA